MMATVSPTTPSTSCCSTETRFRASAWRRSRRCRGSRTQSTAARSTAWPTSWPRGSSSGIAAVWTGGRGASRSIWTRRTTRRTGRSRHALQRLLRQLELLEQVPETTANPSSSCARRIACTAIGNLISSVFYDGDLMNGEPAGARPWPFGWMPAAVTWLSTSHLPTRSETRRGASFENAAEADIVVEVLERMERELTGQRSRVTVGLITGYSAQVERLAANIDPGNERRVSSSATPDLAAWRHIAFALGARAG